MVLAQRVGKERSFTRGFFLSLATVGFYSVYWNYKAHSELFRQFELARENRDEGVLWFLLGLLFYPLIFGYLWTFASNVAYVRQRLMLPPRSGPGPFVSQVAAAVGAFILATIMGFIALSSTADESLGQSTEAAETAGLAAVLFFAIMVILLMVAYRQLQQAINEIWTAYDRRVAQIRATPPVGALERLPPEDPHPTIQGYQLPPL